MTADFKLIAMLLLVIAPTVTVSVQAPGRDTEDSGVGGFDESRPKESNFETTEVRSKWDPTRMGKRVQPRQDNPTAAEYVKRKWTSSNMGMWGKRDQPNLPKRQWSSRNMAMWGRKRASSLNKLTDYDEDYNYGDDDATYLEKRRWTPGGMGMWGKRLDGAINQLKSQKGRWTSGNMAMWGKRSYADQYDPDRNDGPHWDYDGQLM